VYPRHSHLRIAAATAIVLFALVSATSASADPGNGNGNGGNGNGNGNVKHLLQSTPELDSLVLFGTALAGIGSYAALRRRAKR
jgi:hypothetical protein